MFGLLYNCYGVGVQTKFIKIETQGDFMCFKSSFPLVFQEFTTRKSQGGGTKI
jgi:hypothetical protein